MNCAGHVANLKLSLLAASPPYDINSAFNKYSYIHMSFLVEALRSPIGWILDNAHTLTSIFNIIPLHLCFIFGVNIYALFGTKQKQKS